MANTALVKRLQDFKTFLMDHRESLLEVLPQHISLDKFLGLAVSQARKNPKILECDFLTVAGALKTCAELGLEPDVRGLVYLIPHRNNKTGTMDLNVIIGYKGFVELARRSGMVTVVYAEPVYEKDEFFIQYGTDPKIKHIPNLSVDVGEMIGVYAVALFKDGGYQFSFMRKSDIDRIRKMAKTDNIWSKHYIEMARKTVLRRLAKLLPLSPEVQKAVAIDELSEVGDLTGVEIYTDGLVLNNTDDIIDVEGKEIVNKATNSLKEKLSKPENINSKEKNKREDK